MDNDDLLWCATYGAMVAGQVLRYMAEGRGAPDDEAMDRFVEEAEAVADLQLEALMRVRNARL